MEQRYIFSEHESFPCKSLWLKKGYDFVVQGKSFNTPDAVIDLGVESLYTIVHLKQKNNKIKQYPYGEYY